MTVVTLQRSEEITVSSTRLRASAAAIFCAAIACGSHAWAQGYPGKPLRMLVATSAGSNPDTVARVLAAGLSKSFGQQVVVDNRAGAGGNIGAELAARAPADGYTIFLAHTNHSVNATLYKKLTYDIMKDFAPITLVALSPFVASVHPAMPVKTLQDLIKLARSRPGDITYASAGSGSGTFFSAEYFKGLADVNMLHVPYKGGGPALAAVLSGEVSVYFSPIATGLSHFRNGKLRPLAVTSRQRLPQLPDLPPIADLLPGYEVVAWAGLLVPENTPGEIIATIHKAALSVLNAPDTRKTLEGLGYIVVTSEPKDTAAYIAGEIGKYGKIIRQIGLPQQ
jgi:tripartite-type tricarboxylate transporter receptor subunit TctC